MWIRKCVDSSNNTTGRARTQSDEKFRPDENFQRLPAWSCISSQLAKFPTGKSYLEGPHKYTSTPKEAHSGIVAFEAGISTQTNLKHTNTRSHSLKSTEMLASGEDASIYLLRCYCFRRRRRLVCVRFSKISPKAGSLERIIQVNGSGERPRRIKLYLKRAQSERDTCES